MARTTYTATLPNGETIKRATKRTYTHAVVVEYRYTNGKVQYSKAEWAGRPELAEKNAAKHQTQVASLIGKPCQRVAVDVNNRGRMVELDYGYKEIQVHILPVNS